MLVNELTLLQTKKYDSRHKKHGGPEKQATIFVIIALNMEIFSTFFRWHTRHRVSEQFLNSTSAECRLHSSIQI